MSNDETMPIEQSLADSLRSQYYREDGWHATNNAQLGRGGSPQRLMEDITTMQQGLADALIEEGKAKKKFDSAQADLRKLQGARYNIETNLNILKMALSDALDIPK